jgi:hypothetical protein
MQEPVTPNSLGRYYWVNFSSTYNLSDSQTASIPRPLSWKNAQKFIYIYIYIVFTRLVKQNGTKGNRVKIRTLTSSISKKQHRWPSVKTIDSARLGRTKSSNHPPKIFTDVITHGQALKLRALDERASMAS